MSKEGDKHIPLRGIQTIYVRWTEHLHVSNKVCGCYLVHFLMFSNFHQLDLHNEYCVALTNLR